MTMVSVIIPSYNCGPYVTRAIESVLGQTYKEYEIIIVDDGSTDNTKKIVEKYLNFKNINYIYQKNKGVAVARNTGIINAKGNYIAFLDADDYWVQEKLAVQIKVFEKKPDLELIHSNVYVAYENSTKIDKYCMNINYNKLSQKKLVEKILFWEADISMPSVIIKRIVFDRVGYFDEKLTYLGCEDREFFLRAFPKIKTFFLNDYLAYYFQRKNSLTKKFDKMQEGREYLIEKIIMGTDYFKNKNKIRRICYSKLYFRMGTNFFRSENKKDAIKRFIESIKYYFNLMSIFYISICFLPNKLIDFIKNCKNFLSTLLAGRIYLNDR